MYGIYLWYIYGVYIYGIYLWYIYMVYIYIQKYTPYISFGFPMVEIHMNSDTMKKNHQQTVRALKSLKPG